MKTTIRKSVKFIITALITVTMTLGAATSPVSAVSAPTKVSLTSVKAAYSSVTVSWKKASYTTGYQVYRNGAKIATTTKLSFKNTSVKQGSKYSYKVRAYRKYTVKQYYNSKTKKWQSKKPSKKYWKGRKTRKVAKYKYGKFSTTKAATVPVKPIPEKDEANSPIEELAEDGSHMHKWVPQYATREAIDYYTAEDEYASVIVCNACGAQNVDKAHMKAHLAAGEPCNTHVDEVKVGVKQVPHYKTEKYITEYICSVCNEHKDANHTHHWEEDYNIREEIIGYNTETVATGRTKHTCTICGNVIYTDSNGEVIKPEDGDYAKGDYDLDSPWHTYVSEPEYVEQQIPVTTTVKCLKGLKCACGATKPVETVSDSDTKYVCNKCGKVFYEMSAAKAHLETHS